MKHDISDISSVQTKPEVRRLLKQRLAAITEVERLSDSLQLCLHAVQLPTFTRAQTVALFASLPTEPDLTLLMEEAWAQKKRVVLPRILPSQELEWREVKVDQALISPQLPMLREPDPEMSPLVAVEEIEAAFIPGLGYDGQGYRLGRGGGYYDQFLAKISATIPCPGLMFSCQYMEQLPREAHDQALRCVVTEKGLQVFTTK